MQSFYQADSLLHPSVPQKAATWLIIYHSKMINKSPLNLKCWEIEKLSTETKYIFSEM